MIHRLIPFLFVFVSLVLAACGSTSTVGTDPGDPEGNDVTAEAPIEDTPDEGIGDDDGTLRQPFGADENVITNDVIVDPRTTTPSELIVNPDDELELWVRFVSGDPNCTAASATILTETPDAIVVELQVGITEDALSRSCMAGEFPMRVEVQLSESASGKSISAVEADTPEAPLVTPDLSTDDFIGLTEAEAIAIADENLISWRTVRVDDEDFIVTQDFSPDRLNFEVDEGTITVVTLG